MMLAEFVLNFSPLLPGINIILLNYFFVRNAFLKMNFKLGHHDEVLLKTDKGKK